MTGNCQATVLQQVLQCGVMAMGCDAKIEFKPWLGVAEATNKDCLLGDSNCLLYLTGIENFQVTCKL
jgi:hypothetical protein